MELKSFALLNKDDRYLLIREAALKWEGKWFLPGGGIRKGETPLEAAIRETREEAGYEVDVREIFYARYYPVLLKSKLFLFYTAEITGGHLKEKSDKHSLAAGWFNEVEIAAMPLRQDVLELIQAFSRHRTGLPGDHFRIMRE